MPIQNMAFQDIEYRLNKSIENPSPSNVDDLREAVMNAYDSGYMSYDNYIYLMSRLYINGDINVKLQEFKTALNKVESGNTYPYSSAESAVAGASQLISSLFSYPINTIANSMNNIASAIAGQPIQTTSQLSAPEPIYIPNIIPMYPQYVIPQQPAPQYTPNQTQPIRPTQPTQPSTEGKSDTKPIPPPTPPPNYQESPTPTRPEPEPTPEPEPERTYTRDAGEQTTQPEPNESQGNVNSLVDVISNVWNNTTQSRNEQDTQETDNNEVSKEVRDVIRYFAEIIDSYKSQVGNNELNKSDIDSLIYVLNIANLVGIIDNNTYRNIVDTLNSSENYSESFNKAYNILAEYSNNTNLEEQIIEELPFSSAIIQSIEENIDDLQEVSTGSLSKSRIDSFIASVNKLIGLQQEVQESEDTRPSLAGQVTQGAINIVRNYIGSAISYVSQVLQSGEITQADANGLEQLLNFGNRLGIINGNIYESIINAVNSAPNSFEAFNNVYNILVDQANRIDSGELIGMNIPTIPDPTQNIQEEINNIISSTSINPPINSIIDTTISGIANLANQQEEFRQQSYRDFGVEPPSEERDNRLSQPRPVPEQPRLSQPQPVPEPEPTPETTRTRPTQPTENNIIVNANQFEEPVNNIQQSFELTEENINSLPQSMQDLLNASELSVSHTTPANVENLDNLLWTNFQEGNLSYEDYSALSSFVWRAEDIYEAVEQINSTLKNEIIPNYLENNSSRQTSSINRTINTATTKQVLNTQNNSSTNALGQTFEMPETTISDRLNQPNEIANQITQVYSSLGDEMATIIQQVPNVIRTAGNTISQIIGNLASGAMASADTIMNFISQLPSNLLNSINNIFNSIFSLQFTSQEEYNNLLSSIANQIINLISNTAPEVINSVSNIVNNLLQTLVNSGIWNNLSEAIRNVLANIFRILTNAAVQLPANLLQTMTNIADDTLAKTFEPESSYRPYEPEQQQRTQPAMLDPWYQ